MLRQRQENYLAQLPHLPEAEEQQSRAEHSIGCKETITLHVKVRRRNRWSEMSFQASSATAQIGKYPLKQKSTAHYLPTKVCYNTALAPDYLLLLQVGLHVQVPTRGASEVRHEHIW